MSRFPNAIVLAILPWVFACTDEPRPTAVLQPTSLSSLEELDRKILADPTNAIWFAQRALFYEGKDSLNKAFSDWFRAISLDSTAARYRVALGDLYYRKVDLPKAEAQFTKAISLAPDSAMAWLRMAELKLVQRDFVAAMQNANEALRLDQEDPRAYFLKGWIHQEAGDTALAISSYRTAVERDNDYYEAYIALGIIHARKRDPLAMQYYNSAVELRPRSVEAWYDRGMFAQETGQDSVALASYSRIKEIDPANATAWYNTGYIFLEHQDRFPEARSQFSHAISLLPDYHQAYFNRGLAYELQNRLDSALADYKKALDIEPGYDLAAEGLGRLQSKGVNVIR
ncbi:MAG: tetratricopeptide repeat protein [Flavobacteriales bacterium]|nr:tetratricopeptide repeat protein [Flavobacteriales bacterium]